MATLILDYSTPIAAACAIGLVATFATIGLVTSVATLVDAVRSRRPRSLA